MPEQKSTLVRHNDMEIVGDNPASAIGLLADSTHTGGILSSHRTRIKAGGKGAPPHSHGTMAEVLFVIAGELEVLTADDIVTMNAGDLMVIPPDCVHAFAASESSSVDVLCLFTPGVDRFDYYRLLDRFNRGEADRQEVVDSQSTYDNNYAVSAVWDRHVEGRG